jgi:carbamate kinase
VRVVAALGGNALLERGEQPDSDTQQSHVVRAVQSLAQLARSHELIISHGNGPQVGMLALESAGDPELSHPYPFDVLGAQTQGMIGYWLVQALRNALPSREVACLLTQTLVDGADPAFTRPAKFVGPRYDRATAARLASAHGWDVRQDGDGWRRVVPSPQPAEILELPAIRLLVASGTIVVCAGGGGVPVVRAADGSLAGAEAVIDKDLTAAVLALALGAEALLLLTDVTAVQDGYGTPAARAIRQASPADLRARPFPAGSMGPKVEAVCRFVEAGGAMAAIGRLGDAEAIIKGDAGTIVTAMARWQPNRSRGPRQA